MILLNPNMLLVLTYNGFIVSKNELVILNVSYSLIAQLVKNPPAVQETPVQFLGREDPLEKGKATHSSTVGLPLWLSW